MLLLDTYNPQRINHTNHLNFVQATPWGWHLWFRKQLLDGLPWLFAHIHVPLVMNYCEFTSIVWVILTWVQPLFDGGGLFQQDNMPCCKNCSGTSQGMWQRAQSIDLVAKCSSSRSHQASMGRDKLAVDLARQVPWVAWWLHFPGPILRHFLPCRTVHGLAWGDKCQLSCSHDGMCLDCRGVWSGQSWQVVPTWMRGPLGFPAEHCTRWSM